MALIRWEKGQNGTEFGYVGTLRLFGVLLSSVDYFYELRTELPIDGDWLSHEYDSSSDAKKAAEDVFAAFMKLLNANGTTHD
jgi:hypothetical protein